jgi:hypothetical protein
MLFAGLRGARRDMSPLGQTLVSPDGLILVFQQAGELFNTDFCIDGFVLSRRITGGACILSEFVELPGRQS